MGAIGVETFFVISGLVIAMTLVKSQSALDFAVRRFARIYPAYVVAATLLALVIHFAGGDFHVSWTDYLATLTMAAPKLGAKFVDGAYWSLFVEVSFCVVAAATFALPKNRFWIGLIGLEFVGHCIRWLSVGLGDLLLMSHYLPLFLIGMAGWYYVFNAQAWPAAALLVAGLIGYAVDMHAIIRPRDQSLVVPANILLLGSIAVMFALLHFAPMLRLGVLARIGRMSYSLYLVHQTLGVIIINRLVGQLGFPDAVGVAAAVLLSMVLALVMFEVVELRMQHIILAAWHHTREHRLGQPKSLRGTARSGARVM